MSRMENENWEMGWLRTHGLIHSGNPDSGTKPHDAIPRISWGRVSIWLVDSGLFESVPIASAPTESIVLIAFGGFDKNLNAAGWPILPGVRWLVPENWGVARGDMVALESLRMNFSDLLRSVDAVVTKPGYGTFTEAACSGIPVLYVRRDDWPEQDCLIEWLEKNARCAEIGEAELMRGTMQPALEQLWQQPRPALPRPDGVSEAAELIAAYLP